MTTLARHAAAVAGYDPHSLTVDAARAAIRACLVPPGGSESVALQDALGRVLEELIVPSFDVPAEDNAAMDGWALRAADLAPHGETRLREVGRALAGQPFAGRVGAGECVRIMTGAMLPPGADTVVMQEAVTTSGAEIRVPAGPAMGQNVRRAGEDLRRGIAALAPGRTLGPPELGLIASLGLAQVRVRRRLRVAFLSSGDELAAPGAALGASQRFDSNRASLGALLARLGVERIDLGIVPDEPRVLGSRLADAAQHADAIVTSGGVSVGDADHVRAVLEKLGEVLFWKIAMRPGRPMAFGRIGRAYLFGLPGNPVAALVAFSQFVREALLVLAGRAGDCALPCYAARAAEALRKRPGRTEFQRGVLFRDAGGDWAVRSSGDQGSGVLRSVVEANCFIVLEHARGAVAPGEIVQVQRFEWLD
jgi:molybdopterin molybdotransferase